MIEQWYTLWCRHTHTQMRTHLYTRTWKYNTYTNTHTHLHTQHTGTHLRTHAHTNTNRCNNDRTFILENKNKCSDAAALIMFKSFIYAKNDFYSLKCRVWKHFYGLLSDRTQGWTVPPHLTGWDTELVFMFIIWQRMHMKVEIVVNHWWRWPHCYLVYYILWWYFTGFA